MSTGPNETSRDRAAGGPVGADAGDPSGPVVRIKICGLVHAEDAEHAARLGAAYLGFVLAESPRRARMDDLTAWLPDFRRAHPAVRTVGVFVDPRDEEIAEASTRLKLDLVQIHGAVPADSPSLGAFLPWIRAARPDELPRASSEHSAPARARSGAGADGPGSSPAAKEHGASWERGSLASHRGPFAWLVDTPSSERAGGTGRTFDWSLVPPPPRNYRLFLAGGLSAENVAAAIRQVEPYAVDASSRLEIAPGRKDPRKLAAFFDAAASAARIARAGSEPPPAAPEAGGAGPRTARDVRKKGDSR